MFQSTLAKTVQLNGIGLHSGEEVRMKLSPAQANSGIIFTLHSKKGVSTITPSPEAVTTTELATTLSIGDASLSTVEHLLAAIQGLQIDNINIHVYGNEVPILDGSALLIVDAIQKAGRKTLPQERVYAKITKPFSFIEGNKSIVARPYDGLYIDYTIDFPHHSIGKQRYTIDINQNSFKEIAKSRTFGFLREVEYLHSKGLALGGSLANAIVLDEEGVINPDGLRHSDEFVRHKILDFVGDMAMLGLPLHGAFEVKCSGHKHNNLFLHALIKSDAMELSNVNTKQIKDMHESYNCIPLVAYTSI